jgi:chorismate-pyruvate lyase
MIPRPTVEGLWGLFAATCPRCEKISPEELPAPYRELLHHRNHMTVTVERYYGEPVRVRVLDVRHDAGLYSRKILLETSKGVVQFGIVGIELNALSEKARGEITAGDTPLGRVLIQNDVLTRVEPTQFFRLIANQSFAKWFSIPEGTILFGRLGVIYAGDRLAIEVMEVLAPIDSDADGRQPLAK